MKKNETQQKSGAPHVRLLIGGDVCPVRNFERKLLKGGKIFSPELAGLIASHDFFLINLEAPLCEKSLPAFSHDGFGLRCDPDIARCLKEHGVSGAGLANNHILDYRGEGLLQTMRNLEEAGIQTAGAGRNLEEAERPLVIVRNGLSIAVWCLAEQELNCATPCSPGSSVFDPEQNAVQLREMREKYDFVIVYLHAGHEFTETPSPRIRKSCRAFAEAGADLVVCHHPHVIQGVEPWGKSWIAYSLGNLVFDTDYVSRFQGTRRGLLLSVEISRHHTETLEVHPCIVRKEFEVGLAEGAERKLVLADLKRYAECLRDEDEYVRAWERDVAFRWETGYRRIFQSFSAVFFDPSNHDYAIRTFNLFNCPTHLEMLRYLMKMMEGKRLKRKISGKEESHV